MTLQEMFDKINDMYPDKYVTVSYEIGRHSHGELVSECQVYIDGLGFVKGSTYDEIAAILDNQGKIQPIPENLPQIAKEASHG